MIKRDSLSKSEYEAISRLRFAVRKFLRFSEEQARMAGMTHQQFQALLVIRGRPDQDFATVGELADRLQTRHHSAVELVNRLEAAGLVRRVSADHDRRKVRVYLTDHGTKALDYACTVNAPDWVKLGRDLLRELEVLVVREETTPAS